MYRFYGSPTNMMMFVISVPWQWLDITLNVLGAINNGYTAYTNPDLAEIEILQGISG